MHLGITNSKFYNFKIASLFIKAKALTWQIKAFGPRISDYDGYFQNKGKKTFQITESLEDKDIKDRIAKGVRAKVGIGSAGIVNFNSERTLNNIKNKCNKKQCADVLFVVEHCFDYPEMNLLAIDFFNHFRKCNKEFLKETPFKEIWLLNIEIPNISSNDKELIDNLSLKELFQLK